MLVPVSTEDSLWNNVQRCHSYSHVLIQPMVSVLASLVRSWPSILLPLSRSINMIVLRMESSRDSMNLQEIWLFSVTNPRAAVWPFLSIYPVSQSNRCVLGHVPAYWHTRSVAENLILRKMTLWIQLFLKYLFCML